MLSCECLVTQQVGETFPHRNYTCKQIVMALLNPKATEILEKHWGATEKHWGIIDVYLDFKLRKTRFYIK